MDWQTTWPPVFYSRESCNDSFPNGFTPGMMGQTDRNQYVNMSHHLTASTDPDFPPLAESSIGDEIGVAYSPRRNSIHRNVEHGFDGEYYSPQSDRPAMTKFTQQPLAMERERPYDSTMTHADQQQAYPNQIYTANAGMVSLPIEHILDHTLQSNLFPCEKTNCDQSLAAFSCNEYEQQGGSYCAMGDGTHQLHAMAQMMPYQSQRNDNNVVNESSPYLTQPHSGMTNNEAQLQFFEEPADLEGETDFSHIWRF